MPVDTVRCHLPPVSTDGGTAAQAHDVQVTKNPAVQTETHSTLNSNSIRAISCRLVVDLLYGKSTTNLQLVAQMEFEY